MLYSIIGQDGQHSLEKRLSARDSHIERLMQLQDEGRLIIAGPFPSIDAEEPGEAGFSGSLIVAEFNSLEDATEWANNDPYTTQGVFESVTVKPFKKVFPGL